MELELFEWCPYCGHETKIYEVFGWQSCKYCGHDIKPCNICGIRNCVDCPLDEEEKENTMADLLDRYILDIRDNGGQTMDRYFIVFDIDTPVIPPYDNDNLQYNYFAITASKKQTPIGVFQSCSVDKRNLGDLEHLGKHIHFNDLPDSLKKRLMDFLQDYQHDKEG